MKVYAGLMWFALIGAVCSSSADKRNEVDDALVKRSSSQETPDLIDAIHDEADRWMNSITSRPSIIEPSDHLGLITKAVESAYKNNLGPIDDDYFLDPKVMKWLNRVEASVLRDRRLIKKIRDFYVTKMNTRPLTMEQRARAKEKKNKWANLLNSTLDADLKRVVEHAEEMFQEDIRDYTEVAFRQEHDGSPYFIYASTLRGLSEAQESLRLWNSNSDLSAVLKMLNKEMKAFAESVESFYYCGEAMIGTEMMNHAIKAFAWKARARQLLIREARRATEDPLDAIDD